MKVNLLQELTDKEQQDLHDVLMVKDTSEKEPEIEPQNEEEGEYDRKFLIVSSYGELLDLAIHLSRNEKEKVVLCITEKEYQKIGEGIVEKDNDWHKFMGQGWTWIIDGCEHADLQDWLRKQGEYVVGTNAEMSELEDNRQKGQEWFKAAGFKQPESHNFKDIDDAIAFVSENADKRWIMKQNGSAPKSLNHMGKFQGSEDMLYHLDEMKKKWNEQEYGAFDCDLMEIVDGVEIAASAFFNGHDWLRDKEGRVVGFLNGEEKKEFNGNMGETTGETGTTFYGCDETNAIFADILLRKEITDKLRETGFRGVFDINGSLIDDGFVAFEATSRFGIPATSYEFIEGLKSKTADLLCAMAYGDNPAIEVRKGWGMCIVVAAKPYPIDADMPKEHTSIGEKLWILADGKPTDQFTKEQQKHIHLENFYCDEEGNYKVATPCGYLLVVTGTGSSIKSTREKLLGYIKENIYISGQKWRTDIGARLEEHI